MAMTYDEWRDDILRIEAEIKRNMASARASKAAGDIKSFEIFDAAAEACRRERARLMKREPPK